MEQQASPKTKHVGVVRAIKLNSWCKVGASAGHTWRTTPVAHADSSRTHLNEDWRPVSSPAELRAATEARIKLADNVKSDSVLLIEYVISADHKAFIENGGTVDWQKYFENALKFFESKHGRNNIVGVNIQLDEYTPHLVIYAVPLVSYPASKRDRNVIIGKIGEDFIRGKRTYNVPARTALSASHFIGSPEKLRVLQTDFAEKIGKNHGLKRGLKHSAATHVTTKRFHQTLIKGLSKNIDISLEDLNKKGFLINKESDEKYVDRITSLIHEHYKPTIYKASLYDIERQRSIEMSETAYRIEQHLNHEKKSHHKTKQQLSEITEGLSSSEISEIKRIAEKYRNIRIEKKRQSCIAEERKKQANIAHQQKEEEEMANQIATLSATDLAEMPHAQRRSIWNLAVERPDLEPTLFAWIHSGIFNDNGEIICDLHKKEKIYLKNSNLYEKTPYKHAPLPPEF